MKLNSYHSIRFSGMLKMNGGDGGGSGLFRLSKVIGHDPGFKLYLLIGQ